MEKGRAFLFIYILMLIIIISGVYAQEDSDFFDEDAVLEADPGTTPDSPFYFIDSFFDQFGDELEVREEKVAEIRAMIQDGNIDAALRALERYRLYAKELEREVDPARIDEARRSASAIRNALLALESEIPEDVQDEFVKDVIEQEEAIITAAEIANRIKELCEVLSELDPLEYSRTCRTNEDSPQWHQQLDRDLTDAQRQEAEAFFEIMSECFETSGEQCRCEDISITAFAEKCSVIAPLAYACEVEDNEEACDEMDDIEDEEPIEDLLPDYLREVLFRLEDRYDDSQFDNHAPRECREAGATTRAECEQIMFRIHAPPECVEALERGDIDITNERQAREACEAIMFDLEAPFECIEAGLTDFRECGKLMFQLNAPQECINAGLTGEHRSDERKCREIVGGDFGPGDRRGPSGASFGVHCGQIPNPKERLACFDAAASEAQFNQFDRSGPSRGPEDRWPPPCEEAQAFTRASCEQIMRDFTQAHRADYESYYQDEGYDRYLETLEEERQCAEGCASQGKAWDFSNGCTCFEGDYPEGPYPEPGPQSWEGCETIYCGPDAYCVYGTCIPFETGDYGFDKTPEEQCGIDGGNWDGNTCVFTTEPTPEEQCGIDGGAWDGATCVFTTEPTPEEQCATEGGSWDGAACVFPDTTGGVITGNAFLEYYYR